MHDERFHYAKVHYTWSIFFLSFRTIFMCNIVCFDSTAAIRTEIVYIRDAIAESRNRSNRKMLVRCIIINVLLWIQRMLYTLRSHRCGTGKTNTNHKRVWLSTTRTALVISSKLSSNDISNRPTILLLNDKNRSQRTYVHLISGVSVLLCLRHTAIMIRMSLLARRWIAEHLKSNAVLLRNSTRTQHDKRARLRDNGSL